MNKINWIQPKCACRQDSNFCMNQCQNDCYNQFQELIDKLFAHDGQSKNETYSPFRVAHK